VRPRNVSPLALLPLLWLLGTSCSGGRSAEDENGPAVPAPSPSQTRESQAPALYDDEGNLLESDVVVAGLRLPRGLDLARAEDRIHVYTSRVPTDKVARYFGVRLLTGQVVRIGQGAVFKAADVRGVRGGSVKLEVSVLSGSAAPTRVQIIELPPPPVHPLSDSEVRALLKQGRANE